MKSFFKGGGLWGNKAADAVKQKKEEEARAAEEAARKKKEQQSSAADAAEAQRLAEEEAARKRREENPEDVDIDDNSELPTTLQRLRRDLLKFYHHPNNLMFAATKVEQQDKLLSSSAMVPVYLREVFQSDLSKVMVEISKSADPEEEEAPEIKYTAAGDKDKEKLAPSAAPKKKIDPKYEKYNPKLISDKQPELTEASLKKWCEDLFLAPIVENVGNFKTYANSTFAEMENQKQAKKQQNKERKRKKRFEALVESIPGAGKTELAKRICLEQPFENAIAIYLPLSRINYTPNEVNEFDELLELALGVTIYDGPDPDAEFLKRQKEEEEEERKKKLAEEEEERKKKEANPGHRGETDDDNDDEPQEEAFRWPDDHDDTETNNSQGSLGDDEDEDDNNDGPITGNIGAAAEREVHTRYKFDKDTVSMIKNIISTIVALGAGAADDEDDENNNNNHNSPFGRKSNSRRSLKSVGGRASSGAFSQSGSRGAFPPDEPPIRVVWVVDELDAVDRGPSRTQNFIRDFVSPAGRHSESLGVLRRLYSTPVRNIDSVLCFSRDERNREACVFSYQYFPARRFVLERWTHKQSEEALYNQLCKKMEAIFDPRVIDKNRLRELAKTISSSSTTFFGQNGPFRGSPYLIENFAEIICHFARKSQPADRFDQKNFTLPSASLLSSYVRQFASPLILFEKFISLRADNYSQHVSLQQQQKGKITSNNNNNNNNQSNENKNVEAPPSTKKMNTAFRVAGKLANEMLSNLNDAASETLLSFSFKPPTDLSFSKGKHAKKLGYRGDNNDSHDEKKGFFSSIFNKNSAAENDDDDYEPLEDNWWADCLHRCGLLYRIDRPSYSAQHADAVNPSLKPANDDDNTAVADGNAVANDNRQSVKATMLMSNEEPYTYQFRCRSELEFFAALWVLNPSSPRTYEEFAAKMKDDKHHTPILPFEKNTHRVVWLALAAHVTHQEREFPNPDEKIPKSELLMKALARQFVDLYAKYRLTLTKHSLHTIEREKLPQHQDALNTSLVVECTKAFSAKDFFDIVEQQHGIHWNLPSHLWWMLPDCGQFGLDETMNDLIRRIENNRDKDRREVPACIWEMMLQNVQTAPLSEATHPKILAAITKAVEKTHKTLAKTLPRIRVIVSFDQHLTIERIRVLKKVAPHLVSDAISNSAKKKMLSPSSSPAVPLHNASSPLLPAAATASKEETMQETKLGSSSKQNATIAAAAAAVSTAAAAATAGSQQQAADLQKQKQALAALQRAEVQRSAAVAQQKASLLNPQATSAAPTSEEEYQKMLAQAEAIEKEKKNSSALNNNTSSDTTNSNNGGDKYAHVRDVSLKRVSASLFKKVEALFTLEEATRRRLIQVSFATARTQFQVARFYFRNWVIDSNLSRDLWDVGTEKKSGGNDAWFSAFAPIRRVVDGEGIRNAVELDNYSTMSASAIINPDGTKSRSSQLREAPMTAQEFSRKLEKLETGVCRADTAEEVFGRDRTTGKIRCRLALLEGPPHVGKTIFAQQLCVMQPFFGRVCIYIPFATLLSRHPQLLDDIEVFIRTMQQILTALPFTVDFSIPVVWVLDEIDCVDRSYDKKLAKMLKHFSDAATSASFMTQTSFTPSSMHDFLGSSTNGGGKQVSAAQTPRSGNNNNNNPGSSPNFNLPNIPSFASSPNFINNANNESFSRGSRAAPSQMSSASYSTPSSTSGGKKSARPHDLCLVISREIRENGGCFLDPSNDGASEIPLERWYLGPWSPLLVKKLSYEYWRRLCTPSQTPLTEFYQIVQKVSALPAMQTMCQRPKLLSMVCRLIAVGRIGGPKCPDEFLAKLTPVSVFMMDLAERAQGRVKFGAFKKLIANVAPIAARSLTAGFPYVMTAVETVDPSLLNPTPKSSNESFSSNGIPSQQPTPRLGNEGMMMNGNGNGNSSTRQSFTNNSTRNSSQLQNIPAVASSYSTLRSSDVNLNNNNNKKQSQNDKMMATLEKEMESPDWLANLVILGLIKSEVVKGQKSVGTHLGTPSLYTTRHMNNNGSFASQPPTLPSTQIANYLEQESSKSICIVFSRKHDLEYLAAVGLLEHSASLAEKVKASVDAAAATNGTSNNTSPTSPSPAPDNSLSTNESGSAGSYSNINPSTSIGTFAHKEKASSNERNDINSSITLPPSSPSQQQALERTPPDWNINLRQSWYLTALSATNKAAFMLLVEQSATPVVNKFSSRHPLASIFGCIMLCECSSVVPQLLTDILMKSKTMNSGAAESLFMMCGVFGSVHAIDFFMTIDHRIKGWHSAEISFAALYQCFARACLHADCSYNQKVFDRLYRYSLGTTNIDLVTAANLGSVGCLTWLMENNKSKPARDKNSVQQQVWNKQLEFAKQILKAKGDADAMMILEDDAWK